MFRVGTLQEDVASGGGAHEQRLWAPTASRSLTGSALRPEGPRNRGVSHVSQMRLRYITSYAVLSFVQGSIGKCLIWLTGSHLIQEPREAGRCLLLACRDAI
jgi:hypothetical protein